MNVQQGKACVWILRTGHGNGVHFGDTPPVENVGWKPYFEAPPSVEALTKANAVLDALCEDRFNEIAELHTTNAAQAEQLAAKQAQIDELMLEYCPDEMTPEQVEEWGKHQRPASKELLAALDVLLAPSSPAEPQATVELTDEWDIDSILADNFGFDGEGELAMGRHDFRRLEEIIKRQQHVSAPDVQAIMKLVSEYATAVDEFKQYERATDKMRNITQGQLQERMTLRDAKSKLYDAIERALNQRQAVKAEPCPLCHGITVEERVQEENTAFEAGRKFERELSAAPEQAETKEGKHG